MIGGFVSTTMEQSSRTCAYIFCLEDVF